MYGMKYQAALAWGVCHFIGKSHVIQLHGIRATWHWVAWYAIGYSGMVWPCVAWHWGGSRPRWHGIGAWHLDGMLFDSTMLCCQIACHPSAMLCIMQPKYPMPCHATSLPEDCAT